MNITLKNEKDDHLPGGFSLTEMLLVLVVIGILAGGTIASLQGRASRHALRLAGDDLAGAVRFAQEQARLYNRPCRLVLSDQAFSVEAYQPTGESEKAESIIRPMQFCHGVRLVSLEHAGMRLILPQAIEITPNQDQASLVMILQDRTGRQLKVQISDASCELH